MATFLSSAAALVGLWQAGAGAGAPPESLAVLRARAARDSTGAAWLALGRAYLAMGQAAHAGPGAAHRAPADSQWVRGVLDTADAALQRAAVLLGAAAAADSARVLRVGGWVARAGWAWEADGPQAGPERWGPLPDDLRVPAVLEELGENLLRACPARGVLLTGGDADSYAAWYMRFARGLRPDLLVVRLAAWEEDPRLAARLATALGLEDRGGAWLAQLAARRPVCVTMALERPPAPAGGRSVRWAARPLVWVAGPAARGERVPAHDFVFAALRIALDGHEGWAQPALAVYARAARLTPALCGPLATFQVASAVPACRR
jgi:hypothetical protein